MWASMLLKESGLSSLWCCFVVLMISFVWVKRGTCRHAARVGCGWTGNGSWVHPGRRTAAEADAASPSWPLPHQRFRRWQSDLRPGVVHYDLHSAAETEQAPGGLDRGVGEILETGVREQLHGQNGVPDLAENHPDVTADGDRGQIEGVIRDPRVDVHASVVLG